MTLFLLKENAGSAVDDVRARGTSLRAAMCDRYSTRYTIRALDVIVIRMRNEMIWSSNNVHCNHKDFKISLSCNRNKEGRQSKSRALVLDLAVI